MHLSCVLIARAPPQSYHNRLLDSRASDRQRTTYSIRPPAPPLLISSRARNPCFHLPAVGFSKIEDSPQHLHASFYDTTFRSCVFGGIKSGIYVSSSATSSIVLPTVFRHRQLYIYSGTAVFKMRPSRVIAAGAASVLAMLLCHHRGQAFFVGKPAVGLLGRADFWRKQAQVQRSAGVVRSR